MLQPDLQLSNHHLTFPLSYGVASFIVSGHQGVNVSQDHINDWFLLQKLLVVKLLCHVQQCEVNVSVTAKLSVEPDLTELADNHVILTVLMLFIYSSNTAADNK